MFLARKRAERGGQSQISAAVTEEQLYSDR
jgi:hypothetical protein